MGSTMNKHQICFIVDREDYTVFKQFCESKGKKPSDVMRSVIKRFVKYQKAKEE